jgi:hypothetical protein
LHNWIRKQPGRRLAQLEESDGWSWLVTVTGTVFSPVVPAIVYGIYTQNVVGYTYPRILGLVWRFKAI